MSFQTPITIKRVLEKIEAREYVLPAIQREFVWARDQISALFDSLMRRYPIGSFLFWRVEADRSLDFRFYEFMTKFHGRDFHHNPYLHLAAPRDLTAMAFSFASSRARRLPASSIISNKSAVFSSGGIRST